MTEQHTFHPTILREYDIRGIVDKTLHAEDARHIGRVFATMAAEKCGKSPTIALARDGRLSSPALAAALSQGMQQVGATVLDAGLGPTPMLYFSVYHLQADAGIMVTGSHNPPTHNGFKMMMGHASFFGSDIADLGKRAHVGVESKTGGSEKKVNVMDDYIQKLLAGAPNAVNSFPLEGERRGGGAKSAFDPHPSPPPSREREFSKKLRVAWDPGNGATGEVMAAIITQLQGEHFLINEKIDGTFPAHHPDPTVPENLKQLAALVDEKNCDLGIAFDGDGDRLGVIDKTGRIVWGDQLLLLYAQDVLRCNPGAIVIGDVKSSRVLFEGIQKAGGEPLMWKTGHSHMKSKMKQTGALLAGEMSGHMFFADGYYGFDDAIYAALRLVNLLAGENSAPLDVLLDGLPVMQNTPEIRLECPDERKFGVIEEVKSRLAANNTVFDGVDGVRVELPQGWWLLRASNTGGHLIARAEADTKENLSLLTTALDEQLKLSGIGGVR